MTEKFGFKTCQAIAAMAIMLIAGCAGPGPKKDKDFFTSGDHEADQRADQRMASAEQLKNDGDSGTQTKAAPPGKPAQAEDQKSLYDQLGGDSGIALIVNDFVPRAIADPRVNFSRQGVEQGGFSVHHFTSVTWEASPANIEQLKKHMIQLLCLVTGGPAIYDGKQMQGAHAGLHISNPEFDATVGDLKASLDKLKIPNKEQKELLSIIETTRPEIVEER